MPPCAARSGGATVPRRRVAAPGKRSSSESGSSSDCSQVKRVPEDDRDERRRCDEPEHDGRDLLVGGGAEAAARRDGSFGRSHGWTGRRSRPGSRRPTYDGAPSTARRRWPDRGTRGGDETSSSQRPTPTTSRVTPSSEWRARRAPTPTATAPGACQAAATARSSRDEDERPRQLSVATPPVGQAGRRIAGAIRRRTVPPARVRRQGAPRATEAGTTMAKSGELQGGGVLGPAGERAERRDQGGDRDERLRRSGTSFASAWATSRGRPAAAPSVTVVWRRLVGRRWKKPQSDTTKRTPMGMAKVNAWVPATSAQ